MPDQCPAPAPFSWWWVVGVVTIVGLAMTLLVLWKRLERLETVLADATTPPLADDTQAQEKETRPGPVVEELSEPPVVVEDVAPRSTTPPPSPAIAPPVMAPKKKRRASAPPVPALSLDDVIDDL